MQLSSFADAPTSNPNNPLLSATLTWNPSGSSNNNGNLWNATYSHGGPGYPTPLTFTDTFTYDPVNRLQTAIDSGGWSRSFAYDAYGNMTPTANPAPPTVSFNANNQINGLPYDQTGNQLSVNGNAVAYDFENRVTTETDGVTGAIENYVYDGDGHRVEQYGATPTTVFVYDAMGQLAAEHSTAATTSLCGAFCYLTTDHLGSTRLVTDTSGNVIARHDYLPFGEEVAANTFGRDTSWNTGSNFVNQKFTGKERDSAGLDYFGARYYGSAVGRFTSPDWSSTPEPIPYARLSNPQTFNQYAYVANNPLSRADLDGHNWWEKLKNLFGWAGCWCEGEQAESAALQNLYAEQRRQQKEAAESRAHMRNPGYQIAMAMAMGPMGPAGEELEGAAAEAEAAEEAAEEEAGQLAAGEGKAYAELGQAGVDLANLSKKIARQMNSRGWTRQEIQDTVRNGEALSVVNKATGGGATEYVSPTTGKFVVVDNATKQVLQVSGPGFSPNHLVK